MSCFQWCNTTMVSQLHQNMTLKKSLEKECSIYLINFSRLSVSYWKCPPTSVCLTWIQKSVIYNRSVTTNKSIWLCCMRELRRNKESSLTCLRVAISKLKPIIKIVYFAINYSNVFLSLMLYWSQEKMSSSWIKLLLKIKLSSKL